MGQLIQSTLMKKQGMSNILKTITDSVEKQREKKEKAKQKESLEKVVLGVLGPDAEKKLAEQGITTRDIVGSMDNPEGVLGIANNLEKLSQIEQTRAQELEKEKRLQTYMKALSSEEASAVTGLSRTTLEAIANSNPNVAASLISNRASAKQSPEDHPAGLAGQYQYATRMMKSKDPAERAAGEELWADLQAAEKQQRKRY